MLREPEKYCTFVSMIQQYQSQLLERAVEHTSTLPGVGRKSALRYMLYLLRQPKEDVRNFANSILRLREDVVYCKECHNISDTDLCPICASQKRDRSLICVVENIQDVMQIENTGQYNGLYHVLGGIISPIDGIGPQDIEIASLVSRVEKGEIGEVILALPTTMEGDTTNYYIYRRLSSLQHAQLKVTQIARGVAIGGELEYTDELTLGRSILNRTEFKA